MAGCRRLTDEEIERVKKHLTKSRDRTLFVLGVRTGFRVKEMLSIRVSDVLDELGAVKGNISVSRVNMKGKKKARSVVLHREVIEQIKIYLNEIKLPLDSPLFPSQKGGAISRFHAHHILKGAFSALGLEGKLGTHTLRKTFANKVYNRLGKDLLKTARALGHDRVMNTERYLEVKQDEIDDAILGG